MEGNEIIFMVSEDIEGGYVANALGASIHTQAESMDALKTHVRDAVRCHFDEGKAPGVIRLHLVKEEVLAL
jgi:hypothetical protein